MSLTASLPCCQNCKSETVKDLSYFLACNPASQSASQITNTRPQVRDKVVCHSKSSSNLHGLPMPLSPHPGTRCQLHAVNCSAREEPRVLGDTELSWGCWHIFPSFPPKRKVTYGPRRQSHVSQGRKPRALPLLMWMAPGGGFQGGRTACQEAPTSLWITFCSVLSAP